MKPRWQKQRNRALTLIEVVIVIAIVALMFIVVSGDVSPRYKDRAQRINCVSNLKQINLSFRMWEADNNNKYPMAVSVTNGGAMEQVAMGDVADCYRVMSNELSTPRILICPADYERTYSTNFNNDFNASHISYFVGMDATNEANPNMLLTGDDNFQINGKLIGSGVLSLSTNTLMKWGAGRHDDPSCIPVLEIQLQHHFCGNLGYADGSVAEVSDSSLQGALQQTGLATNRLAIP
jgi:prepilin-type N-terminal cleavage/methylation domain-containing protein